jgi:phosphoglycerate dehydrogenase-like enzyme
VAALKMGRPGFAAVDVYDEEPLPRTDHPLLQWPNVVLGPVPDTTLGPRHAITQV